MTVLASPLGTLVQTVSVQDSGTPCSVTGTCAVIPVGAVPSLTLGISGTFSGTLTAEATVDGQTWAPIGLTKLADGTTVATATAAGLFAVTNTGLAAVRLRGTTWASGAATVVAASGLW